MSDINSRKDYPQECPQTIRDNRHPLNPMKRGYLSAYGFEN